jgi:hypothetical protein
LADELDRLFQHIVRTIALRDELLDVELLAGASESGDAILAEKHYVEGRESDQARQMRESFRAGLISSFNLDQNGGQELRLSDRDPVENSIADALIRYLVSFGLAQSRTEEAAPGHYIYHLSVNWDRVRSVAAHADIDLDAAIGVANER